MPDLIGALLEPELAELLAWISLVEEAERHRGGVLAEEGEVDAGAVPGGAERVRATRAGAGSVGHRWALPQAGISQTAASGGKVSATECGCPCHGVGSLATPPALPTSVPPYAEASELMASR